MRIEDFFWIGFVGGCIALIFAIVQLRRLLLLSREGEVTEQVTALLRAGELAWLKRCVIALAVLLVPTGGILYLLWWNGTLADWTVPVSALTGALSALAVSYGGMKLALVAAPRSAWAAGKSLESGLGAQWLPGTVIGFFTVAVGLFEVTGWFFVLRYSFALGAEDIARVMSSFGFGGAIVPLLLRPAGAVFAQAARMGGTAVDEEDRPLPAPDPGFVTSVVAAAAEAGGMAAGFHGFFVLILLAAQTLAAAVYTGSGAVWNAMLLPLLVTLVGVVCSLLLSLTLRCEEHEEGPGLYKVHMKNLCYATLLTLVVVTPVTYVLLGSWQICAAIGAGLAAGCILVKAAEYEASWIGRSALTLAVSAEDGQSTLILSGLARGMRAGTFPFLVFLFAAAVAYFTGGKLYGVALAGVGLLSVMPMQLAIAVSHSLNNAATGTARMAGMGEECEGRLSTLHDMSTLGSASGRGYAMGAATLVAVLLLAVYSGLVKALGAVVELSVPPVLVGLLTGGVLAFAYASRLLTAVQWCGRVSSIEFRRQIKAMTGRKKGQTEADYRGCVKVCGRRTFRELILPILWALAAPPAAGFLLGPGGMAGLLGGLAATGLALGHFLTTAGSAWEGAGRHAAMNRRLGAESAGITRVGDEIGGPLRAVAGPTLCPLICYCAAAVVFFSHIFVNWNLPLLLG